MGSDHQPTGELAIDRANTLVLQRHGGATADLLAGREGLARWLRATGGPDGLSARPRTAVTAVNRAGAAAPAVTQLEAGELVVRYDASPPEAFLADIAGSAIALVGGPARARLRRCGAPGCGRWFLASRPRQTWCSAGCGNRARLARFQQRRRATSSSAAG